MFKDIKGFEGLYQITDDGRVWSHRTQKYLATRINSTTGYVQVDLFKDGKKTTFNLHKLIGEAFIPNPDGLPQLNHLDEDKTNNNVSNLCWTSSKENANYGTRNERMKLKLSKLVYCPELNKTFNGTHEAASVLGLHQASVWRCCNNKQKTTGGLHFAYKEVEYNEI